MRLSDWRSRTPHRDSLTSKVVDVVEPLAVGLGAERDPSCWIAWGDDPAMRYVIFIPTVAGLLQLHVRVNVPQEGPRASGKLVRWNRVQIGELAMEVTSGHRLISFQVEGQVLKGSDAEADAIATFALELIAAIDGRTIVAVSTGAAKRARAAAKPAARRAGSEPLRLPPSTRD